MEQSSVQRALFAILSVGPDALIGPKPGKKREA